MEIVTDVRNKGFTLLELLVVLTIFGLLMAFVIASLQTSKSKSRDQRRVSDIQQLQLSLETFFEKNHNYPDLLNDLQIAGEYISEVPIPPSGTSQTSYFYAGTGTLANCSGYHLGAVLENEIPPLEEDSDRSPRVTTCSGLIDFFGASEFCGAAASSPDKCYDVVEQ